MDVHPPSPADPPGGISYAEAVRRLRSHLAAREYVRRQHRLQAHAEGADIAEVESRRGAMVQAIGSDRAHAASSALVRGSKSEGALALPRRSSPGATRTPPAAQGRDHVALRRARGQSGMLPPLPPAAPRERTPATALLPPTAAAQYRERKARAIDLLSSERTPGTAPVAMPPILGDSGAGADEGPAHPDPAPTAPVSPGADDKETAPYLQTVFCRAMLLAARDERGVLSLPGVGLTVLPHDFLAVGDAAAARQPRPWHGGSVAHRDDGAAPPFSRVRELLLPRNRLLVLPSFLASGFRYSLRRLHVPHNSLRALPENIGEMCALEELDVSDNRLRALPLSIGGCTNIRRLAAAGNRLVRASPHRIRPPPSPPFRHSPDALFALRRQEGIPPTLARCLRLAEVDLARNRLEVVPPALASLPELSRLDLR